MNKNPETPQTKTPAPLYCWEIIKRIPDPRDDKKQLRISEIVAARHIDQILEYLSLDRIDENTEIESIVRFGPIVSILEDKKEENDEKQEI